MKSNQIKKLIEQIVDTVYTADTTYDAFDGVEDILNKYDIKPIGHVKKNIAELYEGKASCLLNGANSCPIHELTADNAAWINIWDYNAWRQVTDIDSPWTQLNWNVTLVTKMNQLSAQINKATLRGGATTIKTSPWMESLFETIVWYKNGKIGDRFDVIYDDAIKDNRIFIYNERWNDLYTIPKFKMGGKTTNGDGTTETEINELSFNHISTYTEKEVSNFNMKLLGCIIIDNLPKKHKLAISEYY